MQVGIATDHGSFSLKEELLSQLLDARYEVVDLGALTQNPDDDYPDFVIPLAGGRVGVGASTRFRESAPH